MPSASLKAMRAADDPTFQARVRFALIRISLVAIDDADAPRSGFARKVLCGSVNVCDAARAVVANASVEASIAADAAAEGGPSDTFGVDDAAIAFTVAEGDDPAVGVFDKLARANA